MASYPHPLSLNQSEQILTPCQKKFLKDFSSHPEIDKFTFGGGTALSAFYLLHRISFDLDFFTPDEMLWKDVGVWLSIYSKKKRVKLEVHQIQNRIIFNLNFRTRENLKGEVVYFPFQPIVQPKRIIGKLRIDSFIDIAVNKFHALIQRKELKDYIDLYFIINKGNLTFPHLYKWTRLKFDIHIPKNVVAFTFAGIKNFKSSPYRLIQPLPFTQIKKFYESQSIQIMKNLLK